MDDVDTPATITITAAHFEALNQVLTLNQTLMQELTSMRAELASIRNLVPITPTVSPAPDALRPPTRTRKAKDPDPFTGENRANLETFLSQCRLVFLANPESFTTEAAKIFFAGSHLRQVAYSWFEPLLRNHEARLQNPSLNPPVSELDSFTTFATALTAMFGDPDLEKTKIRELQNLRQASTVNHYASEFQRLKAYVRWNDNALYHQFYSGLRDNVKDGLSYIEQKPNTLDELIRKAQMVDQRIVERIQERKSTHPGTPTRKNPVVIPSPVKAAPPLAPTPVSHSDGSTPMDLDSGSPRQTPLRLSPQERERRFSNHLCIFCGASDHFKAQCPQKLASDQRRLTSRPPFLSATFVTPPDPENLSTQE
jgi:hypothetical protein